MLACATQAHRNLREPSTDEHNLRQLRSLMTAKECLLSEQPLPMPSPSHSLPSPSVMECEMCGEKRLCSLVVHAESQMSMCDECIADCGLGEDAGSESQGGGGSETD